MGSLSMKHHKNYSYNFVLFSGECPSCSSVTSGSCFRHNGVCFYRQCGNYNWYEARSRCKQLNMHLAVSVMESYEGLQSWLYDKTCSRVWLGYSKEDWYNSSPGKGNVLKIQVLEI